MDDRKDGTVNATKATHRHHSVGQENVSSVLNSNEVLYDPENPDQVWDADEEVLAALGYKPEFKREFNLYTTFSVSFAVLGLLPSFASTLYYSLFAGTAGMSLMLDFWSCHDLTIDSSQLGMACCYDADSVRCNEYGGACLIHANLRRVVLCCRRSRSSWMGTHGFLDYRLVKLAIPNHCFAFDSKIVGVHMIFS